MRIKLSTLCGLAKPLALCANNKIQGGPLWRKKLKKPLRRLRGVPKPFSVRAKKPNRPAPVQSVPHTVDPEKLEAWRALPEDQRIALREREAVRLFNNAAQMHRDGKLSEAIETYGKSLLLNPKQSDVYSDMGVALRSSHKLEAAVWRAIAVRWS